MKKKRWDQIAFPKLLVSKTAKTTKPKSFKLSKAEGNNTAQSLKANAKSVPKIKNPALTRGDYLGGKTSQGKKAWNVYKDTLIGDRAKTKMTISKWVDMTKGEMEGEGAISGQKRMVKTVDTKQAFWTDAYTGERIHKKGGPEGTSMDHTVSIDRFIRTV